MGDSPEADVIRRARRMLSVVTVGLEDLAADDPYRREHGSYSLAVFGRSVTLVIQNMRTTHRDDFDEWYAPWEAEMKSDELLRFFNKIRSEILKEGSPDFVYRGFYQDSWTDEDGVIHAAEMAPVYYGFAVPNPGSHLGQVLTPRTSLAEMGGMYVAYLRRLVDGAESTFVP